MRLNDAVINPDPAGSVPDVVSALVEALAEEYSLSVQVLWGNAASAVFGAVTVIESTRPDLFPVHVTTPPHY